MLPNTLHNRQTDIETVAPSKRTPRVYAEIRESRRGARIRTGAPDSKEGREAWKRAIARSQFIRSLISKAITHSDNTAIALGAIRTAQRVHALSGFNRDNFDAPDGHYVDWDIELTKGLEYMAYIIVWANSDDYDAEDTLRPLDIDKFRHIMFLCSETMRYARKFNEHQMYTYGWFMEQAQANACNNCGHDKREGWHEVRDGVDGVVCESMTVLDDDVEIEY